MKICIGDNYGLVKILNTNTKSIEFKHGSPKLENPTISVMNNKNKMTINLLRQYDYSIVDYIRELSIFNFKSETDSCFISGFNKTSDKAILSTYIAQDNGKIRVFNHNEDTYGECNIEESTSIEVETDKTKAKSLYKISPCASSHEFYLLHNSVPMKIYDINKSSISFKSRNLPNDELDLQVPIYDTDVCEDTKNYNIFYISTEYGSIRTYDRRAKNRPINDQSTFNNLPIKRINRMISVEDSYICIGDTTGRVCLLEKRKELFPIKTIARATGGITDLIYEGDKKIYSISKDRYFRIYDYNINDEITKVYMKHMLNSFCVISSDEEEGKEEKDENEDEIQEEKEKEEDDEDDDEDDGLTDINWDNVGYDQSFDDDDDDEEDDENREISDKEAKKKGFIMINRKNKSNKSNKSDRNGKKNKNKNKKKK